MRNTRKAFTTAEVAAALGLHENTIRQMVTDGRLKRVPNTGRTIRIAATEFEAVFGFPLEADAA